MRLMKNISYPSNVQDGKWSQPPLKWIKLNVDVALDATHNRINIRCVLKYCEGTFKIAKQIPWKGQYQPKEAKVIRVREALKWMKDLNKNKVQIEIYVLQVLQSLQLQNLDSSFDIIINDISRIAKDFPNLSFLIVKQSVNMVAHLLARDTIVKIDCVVSLSSPLFVEDILLMDMN